jgi:hypothetical protein
LPRQVGGRVSGVFLLGFWKNNVIEDYFSNHDTSGYQNLTAMSSLLKFGFTLYGRSQFSTIETAFLLL